MSKVKILTELNQNLIILVSEQRGEPWDETYKKYPDLLARLIRSETKTERNVFRVFSDYSKRIGELVNWPEIENKIAQQRFAVLESVIGTAWEEFNRDLALAVALGIAGGLGAGGEQTERELRVPVGWTPESAPATEWLNRHTLDLVKGLSKTTRKNMSRQISMGIRLGEDRDAIEARLVKTVKSRTRARLIAQTESVRAYSQGRLLVGGQIGATHKTWSAVIDDRTSDICLDLDGEKIKFNELFEDINGNLHEGPPAHPRCRSGMSISVEK